MLLHFADARHHIFGNLDTEGDGLRTVGGGIGLHELYGCDGGLIGALGQRALCLDGQGEQRAALGREGRAAEREALEAVQALGGVHGADTVRLGIDLALGERGVALLVALRADALRVGDVKLIGGVCRCA